MNEEIVEEIESKNEIKTVTIDDKSLTTWLIFLIAKKNMQFVPATLLKS